MEENVEATNTEEKKIGKLVLWQETEYKTTLSLWVLFKTIIVKILLPFSYNQAWTQQSTCSIKL